MKLKQKSQKEKIFNQIAKDCITLPLKPFTGDNTVL